MWFELWWNGQDMTVTIEEKIKSTFMIAMSKWKRQTHKYLCSDREGSLLKRSKTIWMSYTYRNCQWKALSEKDFSSILLSPVSYFKLWKALQLYFSFATVNLLSCIFHYTDWTCAFHEDKFWKILYSFDTGSF